ncbi:unnamed protein product, partial [Discosporangium mesarthrocarpum]
MSERSDEGQNDSDRDDANSSSDEDTEDHAYGTMARFVPTLVLERLRDVGEESMVAKSAGGEKMADKENKPHMHELDAAVMMVDVSGFSNMCERYAQGLQQGVSQTKSWQKLKESPSVQGTDGGHSSVASASVITSLYRLANESETKGFGAEGVRDALNQRLGCLISKVEQHGGDVMRIAGDALIVLFHQGGVGLDPLEMTELCLACTRCGWDCARSRDPPVGNSGRGS